MDGAASARCVGVSGAVVFFGVARCESALQANGAGGGMGDIATAGNDDCVYADLWESGETAVGQFAVCGVCAGGAAAVELFCGSDWAGRREFGGEREPDFESVFPAANYSDFERAGRIGGFCDCVWAAGGVDGVLWLFSVALVVPAAVVCFARRRDGIGCEFVAQRVERAVSGCGLFDSVPGAVVVLCHAGGLSVQLDSCAVGCVVCAESDGGGGGRVPLGAVWQGRGAGSDVFCFGGDGGGAVGERAVCV